MDRSILNFNIIFCFSIIYILTISCSNSKLNSKYGVEFNTEREKIGLPVLDSTWIYNEAVGVIGGGWINPICKKDIPCHFEKSFLCDNHTILWEQDMYIGPNNYTTVDGSFEEKLFITYYFKNQYWEYVWEKGVPLNNSQWNNFCEEQISLTDADSLLTHWNLK